MNLFTIGHSTHSLERLVQLLDNNGVSMLVDVRTTPASRYQPQFNRPQLEQWLQQRSIEYAFAGKFLGGRPSDPSCYKKGLLPDIGADYLHEVNYPEVMKRSWFLDGIKRLLELAEDQTLAIMCSEEDPSLCHRHHLIAKYLIKENPEISISHIRGNGDVFNAKSLLGSVDNQLVEQPRLL